MFFGILRFHRQRQIVVAGTILRLSWYCYLIGVHFYIKPAPIATVFPTVRYEICMEVFGAGSVAILWLVWLRFSVLCKVLR